MQRSEIEARVREEVETLAGQSVEDAGAELYASGILDSMNVLHLIVFCEQTFGLSIDPFDLNLEMLDSIEKIADFVESRVGGR